MNRGNSKSFKLCGIPIYERRIEKESECIFVFGIPIRKKIIDISGECYYFFGICYRKSQPKYQVEPPSLPVEKYVELQKNEPKEILIVDSTHMGDYMMWRSYLPEIKKSAKYKGYRLTLLGNVSYKWFAEYVDDEVVDQFLWMPDRPHLIPFNELESARRDLHEKQGLKKFYDTIVCVSGNSLNHKMRTHDHLLHQVASRERIIYGVTESGIKPARIQHLTNVYMGYDHDKKFEFERFRDFFEYLIEQRIDLPSAYISRHKVPESLVNEPYIAIAPCTSQLWKMWHRNNWVEFVKKVYSQHPIKMIFVGSKKEYDYILPIQEELHLEGIEVDIKAGLNAPDLISLIYHAVVCIVTDSAPFHVSAVLGTKTLCLSSGYGYYRFSNYIDNKKNVYTLYPEGVRDWIIQLGKGLDPDRKGIVKLFSVNGISVESMVDAFHKILDSGSSEISTIA